MTVLVCIKGEYARDQQIYRGEPTDDIHGEDVQQGWKDAFGSIVLATKTANDIPSAIAEVAKFYDCPPDRFEGYQILL